jgi:large subunit ribosomal protein L2
MEDILIQTNPTSAGRRHMVKLVTKGLHKGRPFSALLEKQNKKAGRNNNGHITTRHRGGGHKQHYRIIDFKRKDKDGIAATVERIEYDPNRSAHIALLCYADGERRYIIAPKGMVIGQKVLNGSQAAIKLGNCLPLANIPDGTNIYCIEMLPGKGAQIARSAGATALLQGRDGEYARIRMRSGEERKILLRCRACIGEVCNNKHSLRKLGKAGAKRWRGIRPTVRGVVMNPVDHPHGGGEGKTGEGGVPRSPWGQPTKGFRTRRTKRTNSMILKRRHKR